ncbi:MAG TPA: polyphosphate kinase 1 [Vicinamibacterales bacterium]|nr:polyphosphate kinase 1 [Vicinamibacterales bacterium]
MDIPQQGASAARRQTSHVRRIARGPQRPALRVLPPREIDPADLKNPALYINRELSWLEFNQRVLSQAEDPSHPLLERIKFLAITASNLDEFFMIRVSTTLKKLREGIEDVAPDGYNTAQQLDAMRARAKQMLLDQAAVWDELRTRLADEHITFFEPHEWSPQVREYLSGYFSREICPVLTPLAFDPGHPFPFISNLSKNFAVVVRHGNRTKFARVKVPDVLPRFIALPEGVNTAPGLAFVFLEDVIRANIHELFPGTQVKGAHLFRIVRDTDLEIEEDEADDLLETVDRSLKQLRHGAIALLQVEADMPPRIFNILADNFEATDDIVVRTGHRLGLGDWMQLTSIVHRPELKDAPFSPATLWHAEEDPEVIFDHLRYQDLLVHHPYQSFGTFESFLGAAVRDPHVVAIKMTLYRIGADSPLIPMLIQAAEAGKQVAVLVELKARFDERNNILWAKRLESHGIHVVYGFADLKTHAKLCLIVRKESDGIQRYVHTATGNYNPLTAKVYTDIGIFTADADIVADVSEVFNYLTGYSNQREFRSLLVAPVQLRTRLTELIMREAEHAKAGRPARMIIKVNAITDDQMIRVLYRASQAGVKMDLLVRGICSLRPGIPGVSDGIRVRSIVGRFLEHSRIYWFENGGQDEMYIGSADLMERNLDRRVETLTPVRDPEILEHLRDVVLHAYMQDTERATVLDSSGRYHKAEGTAGSFNSQQFLLQHYTEPGD